MFIFVSTDFKNLLYSTGSQAKLSERFWLVAQNLLRKIRAVIIENFVAEFSFGIKHQFTLNLHSMLILKVVRSSEFAVIVKLSKNMLGEWPWSAELKYIFESNSFKDTVTYRDSSICITWKNSRWSKTALRPFSKSSHAGVRRRLRRWTSKAANTSTTLACLTSSDARIWSNSVSSKPVKFLRMTVSQVKVLVTRGATKEVLT